MSDVNFKKLNELEVIEEAGESTYAVVEENGVPKRIPGKKLGGGLPEGGAPYQQLVTDGEGVARWEDRTHYEAVETVNEPLNITWDGDTDGLVSASNENGMSFYKISDVILTNEQAKSAKVVINTGEEFFATDEWTANEGQGLIAEDFAVFGGFTVLVARKDNISVAGAITIPSAGIWVAPQSTAHYPASLTTTEPVEQEKTVIKTLDPKYLPEGVGGGMMRVNITMNDDDTYSADKTYAEIAEAITSGIIPYCVFGTFVLSLYHSSVLSEVATFREEAEAHRFSVLDIFGTRMGYVSIDIYGAVKYEEFIFNLTT